MKKDNYTDMILLCEDGETNPLFELYLCLINCTNFISPGFKWHSYSN